LGPRQEFISSTIEMIFSRARKGVSVPPCRRRYRGVEKGPLENTSA
jgi:hypothetical protein